MWVSCWRSVLAAEHVPDRHCVLHDKRGVICDVCEVQLVVEYWHRHSRRFGYILAAWHKDDR